jgi:putative FmdB family regulatory protein
MEVLKRSAMPTYQYACSACQHEFEVFQAFTDTSLTHCPECGGELRKVYSAVGVVFKGSGFYKTDSKSAPRGASTTTASDSASTAPTPVKESSAAPAPSSD